MSRDIPVEVGIWQGVVFSDVAGRKAAHHAEALSSPGQAAGAQASSGLQAALAAHGHDSRGLELEL